MRIALLPLDSRPPSWQFPLRIAQIANAELVSPPRKLLGTLHQSGSQRALLTWLVAACKDADAAVISWDALVYGGLVQSRTEGSPLPLSELSDTLTAIDWRRCAGYLWLTVPRLGMTIASPQDWELHKQIADYFRVWGEAAQDLQSERIAVQLREVEAQLWPETIARAWWLRRRNADYARDALQLAATLGLRSCHVAVEDNARTGPHIEEVAELRKLATELTVECRRDGREAPRYTFFDGTDEVGSLLTARAILDDRQAPPLPVRLTLFPSVPSPDQYFGLYESHSLEDGLLFLAKFLGFEYRHEAKVQWLVCFGKQPQPDVFAQDPDAVFNNPLLLPPLVEGDEPLFLADLQACNGGNPNLLLGVAAQTGHRLRGVSAWNTNFNALGLSAATVAVASLPDKDYASVERSFVERIADDYIYQSRVRARVNSHARLHEMNPLDMYLIEEEKLKKLEAKASYWGQQEAFGRYTTFIDDRSGLTKRLLALRFTFPWKRVFEIEVHFDPVSVVPAQADPASGSGNSPVAPSGDKPLAPTISGSVR